MYIEILLILLYYKEAMDKNHLKKARRARGWSQAEAAARAGVSQPYWSLFEHGKRPLPPKLARRLVRECDFPPTLLPLPAGLEDAGPSSDDELAEDLAKLGYPAFAYLRSRRQRRNPALVVLTGLAKRGLDPRVFEGLPWLLLRYPEMDTDWLADQARRHDLQNRLGFTASLARQVGETNAPLADRVSYLQVWEAKLRPSRLTNEDMLGERASERMRQWLRANRSEDAAEWNLLTDWKPEHLRYVEIA